MKVSFEIELELSDDEIEPGDLFYFRQHGGLPTIRRAKEKEHWNGWSSGLSGENPYKKIIAINGVLISPKMIFGNLTSIAK
jgi:hypothetical protein